jgi:hypothetical protein
MGKQTKTALRKHCRTLSPRLTTPTVGREVLCKPSVGSGACCSLLRRARSDAPDLFSTAPAEHRATTLSHARKPNGMKKDVARPKSGFTRRSVPTLQNPPASPGLVSLLKTRLDSILQPKAGAERLPGTPAKKSTSMGLHHLLAPVCSSFFSVAKFLCHVRPVPWGRYVKSLHALRLV